MGCAGVVLTFFFHLWIAAYQHGKGVFVFVVCPRIFDGQALTASSFVTIFFFASSEHVFSTLIPSSTAHIRGEFKV